MVTGSYRPRLILRLIWHAEFAGGQELARHVYSRLCRDAERPASRGLGIPVYFHNGLSPADARLPDAIELADAESTVVIALLDTNVRADLEWTESLRNIDDGIAQSGKRHLFVPVACESNVLKVVRKTNCIRLDKVDAKEQPEKLVATLTHELARLLLSKNREVRTENFGSLDRSYAPVKLFLSHSKHGGDGAVIAAEIRDYGRQHLPIATFYDSNDIAAGHDFEQEIKANVADSAMVVIHTDTYSDRPWCRKEVLSAKQYGCPVLVVHAVTSGEDRLFPYLGNAPTVRWDGDSDHRCEIVIHAALREVLRDVYFLEHVETLKKAGLLPESCIEIGTAPEMLTYRNLLKANKCDRAKHSVLLYPDPPLGDEEIEVLEDLNPANVTFTTPTGSAISAESAHGAVPLKGAVIGVSISNSPDLAELGMAKEHLEDAMVECARHVLAQGGSLAYGGDLRPGGFTTVLFELLRSHNRAGSEERIYNFLAWPIHLRLDAAVWHEYLDEARFHHVRPPADLGIDEAMYIAPDDATGRYVWARSLTAMREEMNARIAARVLLGGQVTGFKGKYPGLFEEAVLALRSDRPLYLIGGFGGCTRMLADALEGKPTPAFTEAFQLKDPVYGALIERYASDGNTPIDYGAELEFLRATGIAGLKNGLSDEENRVLFTSRNLPEIMYLLLKGLTKIHRKH